jgi:hypothetical protein
MTERNIVMAYTPRRPNPVSALRDNEIARCSHTTKYESAEISDAVWTITKTVFPNSFSVTGAIGIIAAYPAKPRKGTKNAGDLTHRRPQSS